MKASAVAAATIWPASCRAVAMAEFASLLACCMSFSLAIAESYQRRGYGYEVGSIIMRYFFERTPAHNIEVGMASWNQAALQFALKLGFSENGAMRRAGFRQGQYYDWLDLDILRPECCEQKGGV